MIRGQHLVDPELVREMVAASRSAQGLPPTIVDHEVLERVWSLLRAARGPSVRKVA